SASDFGLGASRPIIRGLGGSRVRILELFAAGIALFCAARHYTLFRFVGVLALLPAEVRVCLATRLTGIGLADAVTASGDVTARQRCNTALRRKRYGQANDQQLALHERFPGTLCT
ncbi:MAG: hypothetical protein L0Y57_11560, partial [Beijerinckiaceae bacterium]|nr:hypothetical protein [Beijerinckiaceae bacterium]